MELAPKRVNGILFLDTSRNLRDSTLNIEMVNKCVSQKIIIFISWNSSALRHGIKDKRSFWTGLCPDIIYYILMSILVLIVNDHKHDAA